MAKCYMYRPSRLSYWPCDEPPKNAILDTSRIDYENDCSVEVTLLSMIRDIFPIIWLIPLALIKYLFTVEE